MANAEYLSTLELDGARAGRKYPNPFFNLANNFLPKEIKTLFKFCTSFYHTDTFLSNIVDKLTRYPITDLLFAQTVELQTQEKVLEALKKVKLRTLLVEMGLDYYVYGNSFVSAFMVPKRFLVNPKTNERIAIEDVDFKLKDGKFIVETSGEAEEWKIDDLPIKSFQNFKLTRWNPENIDIDFNPITGDVDYFYNVPNDIKSKIKMGDPHILRNIPYVFIEASLKNKKIKIEKSNFFHFKRATLAEEGMAWGKPLILPAMKKIYYLQTLQRGNEAIAHEHIVPKKTISPASNGVMDPFATLNMSKWVGQVQEQIKKWRADPNHIGVFPIPMQYQELGGNARSLLLTQEMEFLEEVIINSLGIPVEFIKGGASWSGSSVSLRMIENLFVPYRLAMEDFINDFLLAKLHEFLEVPKTKMKFQKLKMADDAQAKQLVLQLNEAGKLSDARLLDEFGYNWNEESALAAQVRDEQYEAQEERAKLEAKLQGESGVILAKYQIRAQKEAQWEDIRLQYKKLESELQGELGQLTGAPLEMVESLAMQIFYNNDLAAADKLSKEKPVLHSLVMQRIQALQIPLDPVEPRQMAQKKQGSNAKKAPGAAEGDKVPVPTKEKTRANSRGAQPQG